MKILRLFPLLAVLTLLLCGVEMAEGGLSTTNSFGGVSYYGAASLEDKIWGYLYTFNGPCNSYANNITVSVATNGPFIMKALIYDYNGAGLLANSTNRSLTSTSSTTTFFTFEFDTHPLLTVGHQYWLCIWSNLSSSLFANVYHATVDYGVKIHYDAEVFDGLCPSVFANTTQDDTGGGNIFCGYLLNTTEHFNDINTNCTTVALTLYQNQSGYWVNSSDESKLNIVNNSDDCTGTINQTWNGTSGSFWVWVNLTGETGAGMVILVSPSKNMVPLVIAGGLGLILFTRVLAKGKKKTIRPETFFLLGFFSLLWGIIFFFWGYQRTFGYLVDDPFFSLASTLFFSIGVGFLLLFLLDVRKNRSTSNVIPINK